MVLYMPVPFKPGITTPTSIDDCTVEYWVPHIRHQGEARKLDLYRKTIKITVGNAIASYTVHFANQMQKFPINNAVQPMAMDGAYTKWVGAILIVKSDDYGCPITCNGIDSFHIPEAMEWLVPTLCTTKQALIYYLRFFATVNTKSPYKIGEDTAKSSPS